MMSSWRELRHLVGDSVPYLNAPADPNSIQIDARQVRRWGIAGCVRNCCFEELDHAWLLHEVKVVPHLLVRLSDDADEYDFDEKVNVCSEVGIPLVFQVSVLRVSPYR